MIHPSPRKEAAAMYPALTRSGRHAQGWYRVSRRAQDCSHGDRRARRALKRQHARASRHAARADLRVMMLDVPEVLS
jgi:hypothetical protein